MSDDGGFAIVGEIQIQHAEIHRLVACLGIQASTGMVHSRGSMIRIANGWSGSPKRTAKGALEDLVVWFYNQGGSLQEQWSTVNRALGEDRGGKLARKCERIVTAKIKARNEEAAK